MRHRLFLPERLERNKIQLPSGDHAGAVDDFSPRVNWNREEPSARARKTCVRNSLFSPSISAQVSV
jgi:hypothetical protein